VRTLQLASIKRLVFENCSELIVLPKQYYGIEPLSMLRMQRRNQSGPPASRCQPANKAGYDYQNNFARLYNSFLRENQVKPVSGSPFHPAVHCNKRQPDL
jgi:hypothetical protein